MNLQGTNDRAITKQNTAEPYFMGYIATNCSWRHQALELIGFGGQDKLFNSLHAQFHLWHLENDKDCHLSRPKVHCDSSKIQCSLVTPPNHIAYPSNTKTRQLYAMWYIQLTVVSSIRPVLWNSLGPRRGARHPTYPSISWFLSFTGGGYWTPFFNYKFRDISHFPKIPVRSIGSYLYVRGVTAAQLWWQLSNIDMIFYKKLVFL